MRAARILLLLTACTGGAADRVDGGLPEQDGAVIEDAQSGGDAGGDGGGVTLPSTCTPPAPLPADPLVLTDRVDVGAHPLTRGPVHMLDLERDPGDGRIYAVGVGGLYVFGAAPRWELLGVQRMPPDLDKLELLAPGRVAASSRERGLVILDVSDPGAIRALSQVSRPGVAGMIRVDDLLYVLTHLGELEVFDVSDPQAPLQVGALSGLGHPWDGVRAGPRVYVADNTLGVVVLDASQPTAPAIVASIPTRGAAQDLALGTGALYAAVGGAGIESFDLTDPDHPRSTGAVAFRSAVIAVATAGRWLAGADHEATVLLELSDPLRPAPRGQEASAEWAMDVLIDGDRLLVADWSKLDVLQVQDVRAPELETGRTEHLFPGGSRTVEVALENRGAERLVLTGASVDDPRFGVRLSASQVDAGASERLFIDFADDGRPVDARLCLASNDPDQPLLELHLASGNADTSLAVGELAVDFALPDVDGLQTHRLSEHLGHPVLLVYFATW